MTSPDFQHRPVLIEEVLSCLKPKEGGVYVDCTFGRGGYSQRILEEVGATGYVVALDADPEAIAHGEAKYKNEPRLILRHNNYDRIAEELNDLPMSSNVDGIVFDLGVSSPQLDDAARGFSFRNNGPLDMRMNPLQGQSAADWIASVGLGELTRVIRTLGEEQLAGLIAKHIVRAREREVITTTGQLAEIVFQAFPEKEKRKRKIHPATKVFQAIRMKVNDELGHLERALHESLDVLAIGGVLAVVSFHSLEDRLVKRLFRDCVNGPEVPHGLPVKDDELIKNYEYAAKLIVPSDEEVEVNARARSAKLRAIRKLL